MHETKYTKLYTSKHTYTHTHTHIYIYIYGLLISLWDPGNPLFLCDKCVTPTGKQWYVAYV